MKNTKAQNREQKQKQASNVLVIYDAANVFDCRLKTGTRLFLYPGKNTIKSEDWECFKKQYVDYYNHFSNAAIIEEFEDENMGEKPMPHFLKPPQAKLLIENTMEVEELREYLKNEHRSALRELINKQIEELEERFKKKED